MASSEIPAGPGTRTWTWTLSPEQLQAFWKRKTLDLFSHGVQVRIHITGDPKSPATVIVWVWPTGTVVPPAFGREELPNASTRRREG